MMTETRKETIVIVDETDVIVIDDDDDGLNSSPISRVSRDDEQMTPVSKATLALPPEIQEEPAKKRKDQRRTCSAGVPFVLHDVCASGDTSEFATQWRSQKRFAWSLLHRSVGGSRSGSDSQLSPSQEDLALLLPGTFEVEGIAVCWSEKTVHWMDADSEEFGGLLRAAMASRAVKIQFNMKPQLRLLLGTGVTISPPLWDPKVALWVVEMGDTKDYSLEQVVAKYAGSSAAVPAGVGYGFSGFDACCTRAHQSLVATAAMDPLVEGREREVLEVLEMPLIPIVARMEHDGIGFSKEACIAQRQTVESRIQALEERAQELSGVAWSLSSKQEAADVLFNVLKLPIPEVPGTKEPGRRSKRYPSTNDAVLEILAQRHPVPALLRQHRKLSHLVANNIDCLPHFAHWSPEFSMLRIHGVVLLTSTPTGRISMVNPNLQSVVNDVSFEGLEDSACCGALMTGKGLISGDSTPSGSRVRGDSIVVSIRASFVAQQGHVLVSADYCQLEVRLMAHFSSDSLLREILFGDKDVFRAVASKWLDRSIDTISNAERAKAKGICYGVLYGMGNQALGQQLGCSKEDAARALLQFKGRFSGVTAFLEAVVRGCERDGFVTTLLGRRRSLPGIFSKVKGERRQAERQAINTICQGSGADIVKLAMVRIEHEFRSRCLQSRLILEMHDELVFEVPAQELGLARGIVKSVMEGSVSLSIPLPVVIQTGQSWGTMK